MRLIKLVVPVVLGITFLSGCATRHSDRYAWGDYDGSLYSYYKNPSNSAGYMEALSKIVMETESSKKTIAPGLYAEYGYMLMQQKKMDEAIVYFKKEKQTWPESAYFMDGMIKRAEVVNSKKTAATETARPAQ